MVPPGCWVAMCSTRSEMVRYVIGVGFGVVLLAWRHSGQFLRKFGLLGGLFRLGGCWFGDVIVIVLFGWVVRCCGRRKRPVAMSELTGWDSFRVS